MTATSIHDAHLPGSACPEATSGPAETPWFLNGPTSTQNAPGLLPRTYSRKKPRPAKKPKPKGKGKR